MILLIKDDKKDQEGDKKDKKKPDTLGSFFAPHDPKPKVFCVTKMGRYFRYFPVPTFGAPDDARFGQLALLVRTSHGYLVVTWRSGHGTKLKGEKTCPQQTKDGAF